MFYILLLVLKAILYNTVMLQRFFLFIKVLVLEYKGRMINIYGATKR